MLSSDASGPVGGSRRVGSKNCSQLLGLDIVRNVLDGCNLWYPIEDVPFQLGVQIRVRVTTGMRDRHPSAAGLCGFCRRGEEIPLADSEADDLDAPSEMFPLPSDFTPTVFFVAVNRFVGECPAKLVR